MYIHIQNMQLYGQQTLVIYVYLIYLIDRYLHKHSHAHTNTQIQKGNYMCIYVHTCTQHTHTEHTHIYPTCTHTYTQQAHLRSGALGLLFVYILTISWIDICTDRHIRARIYPCVRTHARTHTHIHTWTHTHIHPHMNTYTYTPCDKARNITLATLFSIHMYISYISQICICTNIHTHTYTRTEREKKRERDCFYVIIVQTYHVELHSRRQAPPPTPPPHKLKHNIHTHIMKTYGAPHAQQVIFWSLAHV